MSLTDEEFREQYKPLQVPAHYDPADTQENKIIFALAQVGEGTAEQVINEVEILEPGIIDEQFRAQATVLLQRLYEKGRLTGAEKNGEMHYDLSKITRANSGGTNPELLAPGLD